MSLLSWLKGLLGPSRAPRPSKPASARPPTARAEARAARTASPAAQPHPPAPLPRRGRAEPDAKGPEVMIDPAAVGVGNLDKVERLTVMLDDKHEGVLFALSERIDAGRFEVPQLPSTSLAAMDMCSRTSADIREISELITSDPLLSSELLKTANSVLYAAQEPAVTLHAAVMRVGLRALRGLILSASMRGALLNSKGLGEYAEEVWRQSVSVALIAREIAGPLAFEREKAYALGLLHDIGKVALLALLRREVRSSGEVTPELVGRVFLTLHERAGAAMARAWRLPEEICSVAGCHHDFRANTEYPRSAALARLAHLMDLHLSLDDEQGYVELAHSDAFDALEASDGARHKVLELGRTAFAQGKTLVAEAQQAHPARRASRASSAGRARSR